LVGKGALFLDEISELSMGLQAKFLTTLQERRIERMGSNKTILGAAMILAAPNTNLEEEV